MQLVQSVSVVIRAIRVWCRNLSFVVVFDPEQQYIDIMNLKTAVQTTKYTKHTKDKNKGLILTGLMSVLCGFVYFVVLMCAAATATAADAAANPYQGIVERNVFGLKPPPPPPDPESTKPPPPKIFLTGITTILGKKRALLKFTPPVTKPGEQPKEQACTLGEGQGEGGLEVLEIDEKAGTVKVSNYGTVATLDFESNGVKTAPGAAPPGMPPGMPPAMRPGMPIPGAMGAPGMGGAPMPTRQLRVPGAGASVTPQATGRAGLPGINTGVNPSVAAQAAEPQGSSSLEENLLMLEVNRIKNQPLVDAKLMPPLPTHPLSEEMRTAITGPEPAPTPAPTPAPVLPPLPPGGPQQLPQ